MRDKPAILLHVSNEKMLAANAVLLEQSRFGTLTRQAQQAVNDSASIELHYFTSELLDQGWTCYWYVLDEHDISPFHLRNVYDVNRKRRIDVTLDRANQKIDVIVARILGPVESRRDLIASYFTTLRDHFTGVTINDPGSVLYGIRKDYLLEFIVAGVPSIPTEYFGNEVSFRMLQARYRGQMSDHIIKPVTGELSNSLAVLADIDESFLRWKELKVGGWLVQPYMPEVWNGEYQLFFIGDVCTHANRKVYRRLASGQILPDQHQRVVQPYVPSAQDIALASDLHRLWRDRRGLVNDISRVDFIKQPDGTPMLLEFETVNPGLFMRYIDEDRRLRIATHLATYLATRCGRSFPDAYKVGAQLPGSKSA